jgi:hypothetical protein
LVRSRTHCVLVVHDEDARARRFRRGLPRVTGGTLAVQPGIDVGLAEPPLPADAHRRNLAGLDQPVDGTEVDLQVGQHLFSCQKDFVNHALALDRRTLYHQQAASDPKVALFGKRVPVNNVPHSHTWHN